MYSSVPPKLPPFSLTWTTDPNDTPLRSSRERRDRAPMAGAAVAVIRAPYVLL